MRSRLCLSSTAPGDTKGFVGSAGRMAFSGGLGWASWKEECGGGERKEKKDVGVGSRRE